jgi:hypothetical protein
LKNYGDVEIDVEAVKRLRTAHKKRIQDDEAARARVRKEELVRLETDDKDISRLVDESSKKRDAWDSWADGECSSPDGLFLAPSFLLGSSMGREQ